MKNYIIVKANTTADKEDLLSILKENLNDASKHLYLWKYINSPYGNARCWLAKEENSGKYVGSGALFPRRIMINGEPITTAIAGDFAVDKEHRVYGPALRLQKTIQASSVENEFKFIYGFPNKLSEGIFLRIGYKELGRFNRFVKLLRVEYKLKEYIGSSLTTKILSQIINFGVRKFSKENKYKRQPNFSIERPTFFDERFDILWERTLKRFPIIGERNSRLLNWRYSKSFFNHYQIFTLLEDRKKILGYIIFYFKENICYIADLLCVDLDFALDLLLSEFIIQMRKEDLFSISISYLGNELFIKRLREFNFYPRSEGQKVVIYSGESCPFTSYLYNKDNWYLFEGDSDT